MYSFKMVAFQSCSFFWPTLYLYIYKLSNMKVYAYLCLLQKLGTYNFSTTAANTITLYYKERVFHCESRSVL